MIMLKDKKNKRLFIISVTIIVVAISGLFLPSQKNPFPAILNLICTKNKKSKALQLATQKDKALIITALDQQKYNLNNMLELMQKYRKIEKSFYTDFQKFLKNRKNVDELKQTLHSFLKEKRNLQKHFNRIKKNTSLKYYFTVIEKNIDSLEEMIEKFNLFSEKIKNETILEISTLVQNFF